MGLTLVTGPVSLTRERTQITATDNQVTTRTETEFRIGNRPASFAAGLNLAPGDEVRAVGKDGAELQVLALHNQTTGVLYTVPCPPIWVIALMVLLPFAGMGLGLAGETGLGGMFFLMGLASCPLGLVMLWKRARILGAVRLLDGGAAKP